MASVFGLFSSTRGKIKAADSILDTVDPPVVTDSVVNEAITAAKLATNSVTEDKINSGAVTVNKIAAGAVTTSRLDDAAVTAAKIASDAVTTDKLLDSNVTTAKLADGLVTTAKLSDAAVTANKLDANSVTNDKLSDGAVTNAKIDNSTIQPGKLDVTADWNFTSGTLQATTPSSANHVANKSYVDGLAQGLVVKPAVKYATVGALNGAPDYVAGVLTATMFGALGVDGASPIAADRVLVKNQASQEQNGIYVVTTEGDGGTYYVLTRASDLDSNLEAETGCFTFVQMGDLNAGQGFVLISDSTITIGTDPLVFTQFSGVADITAGDGVEKSGNTLSASLYSAFPSLQFVGGKLAVKYATSGGITDSINGIKVNIDGDTLTSGAGGLKVAPDGITGLELGSDVAGQGLSQGGSGELNVNLGAGVQFDSDSITVKVDDFLASKVAVVSTETNDATPTNYATPVLSATDYEPLGAYLVKGKIVANAAGGMARIIELSALFINKVGGMIATGSQNVTVHDGDAGMAAVDASFVVSSGIKLCLTGLDATTISWEAYVEIVRA